MVTGRIHESEEGHKTQQSECKPLVVFTLKATSVRLPFQLLCAVTVAVVNMFRVFPYSCSPVWSKRRASAAANKLRNCLTCSSDRPRDISAAETRICAQCCVDRAIGVVVP
jgi:hypothetical protein